MNNHHVYDMIVVGEGLQCSMDEWKKHTVSVPLLNEKQLVARSMIRK